MDSQSIRQIVPNLRDAVRSAQKRRVTYLEIVGAAEGRISKNFVAGLAQGTTDNITVAKAALLAEALGKLESGK